MKTPYTQEFCVDSAHIDSQDILDGLYYPFYLESCRHSYARDILGLDIAEQAKRGINIVLTQYYIKFKRSLRRADIFLVTCEAHPDAERKAVFHFTQQILRAGKLVTEAVFTATFIPAAGGRPYIPQTLADYLANKRPIGVAEF